MNRIGSNAEIEHAIGASTDEDSTLSIESDYNDIPMEEIDTYEEEDALRRRNLYSTVKNNTTTSYAERPARIRTTQKTPFITDNIPIHQDEITSTFNIASTNLPSTITSTSHPVEYFNLFMDTLMLTDLLTTINNSILDAENHRASQNLSSTAQLSMNVQGIAINELRLFFAIQLYMGIVKLREEEIYFKTKACYYNYRLNTS